jgi:hypothetical protein
MCNIVKSVPIYFTFSEKLGETAVAEHSCSAYGSTVLEHAAGIDRQGNGTFLRNYTASYLRIV